MIDNFCKFVADIEADPEAIVSNLTIQEYLLLRQHIYLCEDCYDAVERVNKRYKDKMEGDNNLFMEN